MRPNTWMTTTAARALDSRHEKRGWGQAPVLVAVYAEDLGDEAAFSIAECPGFAEMTQAVAGFESLRAMARQLSNPEVARQLWRGLAERTGGGFIGLGLVCESVYAEVPKDDPEPPKSLMDAPGAYDTLNVVLVDIVGRVVIVNRRRNKVRPDVAVVEPGGCRKVGGEMIEALRDMCLPIAALLPEGDVDLVSLATCVTVRAPGRHLVFGQD